METLTPEQRRALAQVLDELIPPSADGRLPGAGALGLASGLEEHLARSAGALATLGAALDALAAEGFGARADAERTRVLQAFAEKHPSFVPGLFAPTCLQYYGEPRVMAALGLEPRPPHPKGYAMEPSDLSGLEAVRKRGKIYRDV